MASALAPGLARKVKKVRIMRLTMQLLWLAALQ
jgi:hypothetical protein